MHAPVHTLPGERTARTSRRTGAMWDADALAAVWDSQRDVVDERVTVIEQATRALAEDRLDADLRDRAQRAAHMLTGSLGMFGFGGASAAAGEIESALSRPTPGCAAELSALLADVRRDIA
jgi:chemotaxis protein histidine kinase CheA